MRSSAVRSSLRACAAAVFVLALIIVPSSGAAQAAPGSTEIQVLAINDFHGRIEAEPAKGIAGAAVLAGAVEQLRVANPNTVLVSAGDNIGGSSFASFSQQDNPAIDALAAAGLEVSTVGNHEFDRGYDDLTGRAIVRYGQPWFGLGANVRFADTGEAALPEYKIVERDGIKIGFIGTVTQQTATSVTAKYVDGLRFDDQAATANRVAAEIASQVDLTVLLTHEGAASSDCSVIELEQTPFGALVRDTAGSIDAIVSGHTHRSYNCSVGGRPVLQTGFYGGALGQIKFRFDPVTRELQSATSEVLPLTGEGAALYPADPAVEAIVADAVAAAAAKGAEPVGAISADILRGGTPPGSDRGVESSLGNLVADIMIDAVPTAQIALVNPGSLRDDLWRGDTGVLTYQQVASVQPFGNTLITMNLTGAQLRALLEEQWQPLGEAEQKRHLGVSVGLAYTYLPESARGSRIADITLNGVPVDTSAQYSIVTNAFLAGGGDQFATFTQGTGQQDTGLNDLQVTIEYFAEHAEVAPAPLGRAVAVIQPEPEPEPEPGPGPGPASPEASGGAGAGDVGELARTGSASGPGLAAAGALLISGLLLLLLRRPLGSRL